VLYEDRSDLLENIERYAREYTLILKINVPG